jgi:hypothetical protein
MWFLSFLTALREGWSSEDPGRRLPTRRDLLCFLDMSPLARTGMGAFAQALPPGYPNVPTWID